MCPEERFGVGGWTNLSLFTGNVCIYFYLSIDRYLYIWHMCVYIHNFLYLICGYITMNNWKSGTSLLTQKNIYYFYQFYNHQTVKMKTRAQSTYGNLPAENYGDFYYHLDRILVSSGLKYTMRALKIKAWARWLRIRFICKHSDSVNCH